MTPPIPWNFPKKFIRFGTAILPLGSLCEEGSEALAWHLRVEELPSKNKDTLSNISTSTIYIATVWPINTHKRSIWQPTRNPDILCCCFARLRDVPFLIKASRSWLAFYLWNKETRRMKMIEVEFSNIVRHRWRLHCKTRQACCEVVELSRSVARSCAEPSPRNRYRLYTSAAGPAAVWGVGFLCCQRITWSCCKGYRIEEQISMIFCCHVNNGECKYKNQSHLETILQAVKRKFWAF